MLRMASRCTDCTTKVTQSSKAVQCQFCDRWTHARCVDISDELYTLLTRYSRSNLSYSCSDCLNKIDLVKGSSEKTVDTPATVKRGQSYCKGSASGGDNAIFADSDVGLTPITQHKSKRRRRKTTAGRNENSDGTLDHPVEEKSASETRDHVSNLIIDSTSDHDAWTEIKRSPAKQKIKPASGTRKTQSDKDSRERCIVIMNAKEPQASNPADRIMEDKELLHVITSKLFDVGEKGLTVVNAFRLGKRNTNPVTSPRPLKVVLESSEDVERILRRTYRLRGEHYRILRDLNQEDRLRMRTAVDELKRRKAAGEKDLVIRNFLVVKRPVRIRWKPVFLAPAQQQI